MDTEIANIEDQIHANRTAFTADAARIKAEPRITDEAKADDIAAAYQRATAEHQRLVEKHGKIIEERGRDLWMQAFGPPGAAGYLNDADRATRARLHSDALEKADRAKDADDLNRLLRVALIAGDASLAAATADRALRGGHMDIVERFAEAYPTRADSINAYLEHEERYAARGAAGKLERAIRLAGPSTSWQGTGDMHPADGPRRRRW